ncbi:MAG: hypothetical protein F6K56_11000 [Moorea sp. SIO3G5]|nr:hypothetical protein [Moorena sp. SIO3G5]
MVRAIEQGQIRASLIKLWGGCRRTVVGNQSGHVPILLTTAGHPKPHTQC